MEALHLDDVKELLNDYLLWLKDKTILQQVDEEWVEITTPSLDRHNDCLQIYVRKEGSNYLLTDDGYIINDLLTSGCSFSSSRRKELLNMTLMGFGARQEHNQIVINATRNNFPVKKHSLLQAMLAVDDMFYLSNPHVSSLFYEDVVQWLDDADIRYSPRIKFTGKSGFDNMFDFVIPKSRQKPERLLQIAAHPDKEKIKDLMFRWQDTRDIRSTDTKSYTLLNDKEDEVARPILDALNNYDSTPVLWSERANFVGALD
jgi:hypothetical protein